MRQRVDGLRRGKKLDTDRVVARVQFAMAQHGHDTRRSGLFLRDKRAMFTLTAKPFTVSEAGSYGDAGCMSSTHAPTTSWLSSASREANVEMDA